MPNTQVVMETSHGTIKIELEDEKAPITVKNFLTYVDEKFYDGTIFHRVIDGFMVQGGGFEGSYKQKPTRTPPHLARHRTGPGRSALRRPRPPVPATVSIC